MTSIFDDRAALRRHLTKHTDAEQFLLNVREANRRVVVSVEVYDPTGKSSVMRRAATFEEAVKQVKEAMEKG